MKAQVAGITFRHQEDARVKTLRDFLGEAYLKHEPENKFDPKAVKVGVKVNDEFYHVGYLKKGSPEQKAFHEGRIISAKVSEYLYSRGEEDGKMDWNSEHEGVLSSVTLDLEVEEKKSHYNKDGKDYERITQWLSDREHLFMDSDSIQRVKEWNERNQDGLAITAKYGTLVHRLLEEQAKAEAGLGIGTAARVFEELGMSHAYSEQTVFNDELGIAGTYDEMVEDATQERTAIIDWKTSGQTTEKHKLQLAFYCHTAGVKEGYIVRITDKTKKGYSVTKVDVELYYNKLLDLAIGKSLT